ncbi:hypothetical protein AAVH_20799 [Aphelenchoides avenae]|nr:hypothetical protein AAVH_20799 [Aphelenchus avenae]
MLVPLLLLLLLVVVLLLGHKRFIESLKSYIEALNRVINHKNRTIHEWKARVADTESIQGNNGQTVSRQLRELWPAG